MALKLNSDEEIRSSTEYERTLLLQNKLSPASAGGQAGVAASVFNLVNTVVGGGVLSLPYAFSTSGIVLGVFFLYFVVALSIMSLLLLVDGARLSGLFHLATFREMSRKAFGNKGVYLSDFCLVLACFGALCSYLVIIADMLSPLIVYFKDLPSEGLATINRDLIIGILICILFPIACVRYLSIYKYISFGAVVAIAYFVVIVIYQAGLVLSSDDEDVCRLDQCKETEGCFYYFSGNFFQAIPIISFAYTCQMNFLTVYNELHEPTEHKMRKISFLSLGICSTVYLLIGVFGYLTFYNFVDGNIMNSYPDDDMSVIVARMAMSVVIFFSFPMLCHPCTNTLDSLLFGDREFSWFRRVAIVACLCGGAVAIALLVDDVSFIFGLTGATASTAIGFLLPAAIYIKLSTEKWTSFYKFSAYAMFILGFIFMVASTVVTVMNEFGGTETVTPTGTPPFTNYTNPCEIY